MQVAIVTSRPFLVLVAGTVVFCTGGSLDASTHSKHDDSFVHPLRAAAFSFQILENAMNVHTSMCSAHIHTGYR